MATSSEGKRRNARRGLRYRAQRRRKWFNDQPITIRASVIGGIVAGVVPVVLGIVIGIASAMPGLFDDPPAAGQSEQFAGANPESSSHEQVGNQGLQLVDVAYIETSAFPQIDIKLRNTGNEVAFIKRAEIHVEKIWTLEWYSAGAGAPATGNYDIELATAGAPFTQSAHVSQVVDPNGVDRFTFTLSLDDELDPFTDYIYLMSIDLVYDEDDKAISSGDLLYMVGYPEHFNSLDMYDDWNSIPDYVQGSLNTISATMMEVAQVPGIRNERLQTMIDSSE